MLENGSNEEMETKHWNKWFKLEVQSKEVPEGRSGHNSAIYKNNLYVMGGRTMSGRVNDVHKLDLFKGAWQRLVPSGSAQPSIRSGGTSQIYDKYWILYGGMTESERQSSVDLYNFETNEWTNLDVQSEANHDMKRDSCVSFLHKDHFYTWGGDDNAGSTFNTLMRFNVKDAINPDTRSSLKWELIEPKSTLAPVGAYCSACTINGDKVYIDGGSNNRDTFVFDLVTREWSVMKISQQNKPVIFHSANSFEDSVYFQGGYAMGLTNSIHKLDLKTNKSVMLDVRGQPPNECQQHTANIWDGFLVFFGGSSNGGVQRYNDVHFFKMEVSGNYHRNKHLSYSPILRKKIEFLVCLYHYAPKTNILRSMPRLLWYYLFGFLFDYQPSH